MAKDSRNPWKMRTRLNPAQTEAPQAEAPQSEAPQPGPFRRTLTETLGKHPRTAPLQPKANPWLERGQREERKAEILAEASERQANVQARRPPDRTMGAILRDPGPTTPDQRAAFESIATFGQGAAAPPPASAAPTPPAGPTPFAQRQAANLAPPPPSPQEEQQAAFDEARAAREQGRTRSPHITRRGPREQMQREQQRQQAMAQAASLFSAQSVLGQPAMIQTPGGGEAPPQRPKQLPSTAAQPVAHPLQFTTQFLPELGRSLQAQTPAKALGRAVPVGAVKGAEAVTEATERLGAEADPVRMMASIARYLAPDAEVREKAKQLHTRLARETEVRLQKMRDPRRQYIAGQVEPTFYGEQGPTQAEAIIEGVTSEVIQALPAQLAISKANLAGKAGGAVTRFLADRLGPRAAATLGGVAAMGVGASEFGAAAGVPESILRGDPLVVAKGAAHPTMALFTGAAKIAAGRFEDVGPDEWINAAFFSLGAFLGYTSIGRFQAKQRLEARMMARDMAYTARPEVVMEVRQGFADIAGSKRVPRHVRKMAQALVDEIDATFQPAPRGIAGSTKQRATATEAGRRPQRTGPFRQPAEQPVTQPPSRGLPEPAADVEARLAARQAKTTYGRKLQRFIEDARAQNPEANVAEILAGWTGGPRDAGVRAGQPPQPRALLPEQAGADAAGPAVPTEPALSPTEPTPPQSAGVPGEQGALPGMEDIAAMSNEMDALTVELTTALASLVDDVGGSIGVAAGAAADLVHWAATGGPWRVADTAFPMDVEPEYVWDVLEQFEPRLAAIEERWGAHTLASRAPWTMRFEDFKKLLPHQELTRADHELYIDRALQNPDPRAIVPASVLREYRGLRESYFGTVDGMNGDNVARYLAKMLRGGARFSTNSLRKTVGELLGGRIEAGERNAKLIEERAEQAVQIAARGMVTESQTPREAYDKLLDLYLAQPPLATRTSKSKGLQAFSTPAPIAYVASRLAGVTPGATVYEPTAGTGLLLLEANPAHTVANELDEGRRRILEDLGYQTSNYDAAKHVPEARYDIVLANPPFGQAPEGSDYPVLEHQIALNALRSLDNEGRAVLLIASASNKVRAQGDQAMAKWYSGENRVKFFRDMYQNFNVTGHVTLNGDMYAKQGASFPIDMLVIDGRRPWMNPEALAARPSFAPATAGDPGNVEALGEVIATYMTDGPLVGRTALDRAFPDLDDPAAIDNQIKDMIRGEGRPLPWEAVPTYIRDYDELGGLLDAPEMALQGDAGSLEPAASGPGDTGGPGGPVAPPADEPGPVPPEHGGSGGVDDGARAGGGAGPAGGPGGASGPPPGVPDGGPKPPESGPEPGPDATGADEGAGGGGPQPPAGKRPPAPGPRGGGGNPPDKPGGMGPQPGPTKSPRPSDKLKDLDDAKKKRIEELKKKLKKKLAEERGGGGAGEAGMPAGIDPDVFRLGAELGAELLDADIISFPDFATTMVDVVGEDIIPALKQIYGGAFMGASPELQGKMTPILDVAAMTDDQVRALIQPAEAEPPEAGPPEAEPPAEKPPKPAKDTDQDVDVDGNPRQVPYKPGSTQDTLDTLIPTNLADGVQQALERVAKEHGGSLDQYVANELDYTQEELRDAFGAEQVDAIALGIHNAQQGKGFILGDQTGVGKGRVVAAMIHWARRRDMIPVFITEQPSLYADMIRDLTDIGQNPEVQRFMPLVTNENMKGPKAVTLPDGRTLTTEPGQARVLNDAITAFSQGKGLQARVGTDLVTFDAIFTTYTQLQTVQGNVTRRMSALGRAAPQAFFIMDESHNAGGTFIPGQRQSGGIPRSQFIRMLLANSPNGAFYASATFAKRPSVMDLYFTTDLQLAVSSLDDLVRAVGIGGVPLQQVISRQLAEAGQYVRREKSFKGIAFTPRQVPADMQKADSLARFTGRLFNFDLQMDGIINALNGGGSTSSGGTGVQAANTTKFSSVLHNLVNQALLAYKIPGIVTAVEEAIAAGEKPWIVLNSTMESLLTYLIDETGAKIGDPFDVGFNEMLIRYLKKTREFVIRQDKKATPAYVTDDMMGPALLEAYERLMRELTEAGRPGGALHGIPASPIDLLRFELEKRGLRVGEITGRSTTLAYREDGPPLLSRRPDEDTGNAARQRILAGYNGAPGVEPVDVLIGNQAARAGLSGHASPKNGADLRPRHQFIAQADPNVDSFMQHFGRVNRTGQVVRPRYTLLMTDMPLETRPAAVLLRKMASLNANTTAAKDTAMTFEAPDFMNEVGDEAAAMLMEERPDLHEALGGPLNSQQATGGGYRPDNAIAKVTGRVSLMPVAQQRELYAELIDYYESRLEQLDAMGVNPLVAKTHDLDARTMASSTVFRGDPNNPSPLAAGAVLEHVDMKKLGRPTPYDDVQKLVDEQLGTVREQHRAEARQAMQAADIGEQQGAAILKMAEAFQRGNVEPILGIPALWVEMHTPKDAKALGLLHPKASPIDLLVEAGTGTSRGTWLMKRDGSLVRIGDDLSPMIREAEQKSGQDISDRLELAVMLQATSGRIDGRHNRPDFLLYPTNELPIWRRETIDKVQAEVSDYVAKEIDEMRRRLEENPKLSQPEIEERIRRRVQLLTEPANRLTAFINQYGPGVAVHLTEAKHGERFIGIISKIERRGRSQNPAANAAWKVTVHVADSANQITFSVHQTITLGNRQPAVEIRIPDGDDMLQVLGTQDLPAGWEQNFNATRENRFLVTGNLLAGYGRGIPRGSIVAFTRSEGIIDKAVLLPRSFDPQKWAQEQPVRIDQAKDAMTFLDSDANPLPQIGTEDGNLSIARDKKHGYRLTAASGQRGRRYTQSEGLLDAIRDTNPDGFVSASGSMRASVTKDMMPGVFEALRKERLNLVAQTQADLARRITGQEIDSDFGKSDPPTSGGGGGGGSAPGSPWAGGMASPLPWQMPAPREGASIQNPPRHVDDLWAQMPDDVQDGPEAFAPVMGMPLRQTPPAGYERTTNAPAVIRAMGDAVEEALRPTNRARRVPMRVGHVSKSWAAGVFKVHPAVARIRVANDIPTAAHEFAHAMEWAVFGWDPAQPNGPWVGGMIPIQASIELNALGRALYGSRKPSGGYYREGFAEFVRLWVTSPNVAQTTAPEFHTWWTDTFLADRPKVKQQMERAQDLYSVWSDQGAVQRGMQSMIDPLDWRQRLRNARQMLTPDRAMSVFVEALWPLHRMAQEAEHRLGRTLRPSENPYKVAGALQLTHDAIVERWVESGLTDFYGRKVGPPLKDIAALVKAGDRKRWMVYLWAKRALALWHDPNKPQGRNPGLSASDAAGIVRELETPEWERAATLYYQANEHVLDVMAQSSPVFDLVVRQIRKADPGYYMPLQREFDDLDSLYLKMQGGRPNAEMGKLVDRLTGSGRRVKEPIAQTIARWTDMLRAAHQRHVIDRMLALSNVPGMGEIIERIPRSAEPALRREFGEILKDLEKIAQGHQVSLLPEILQLAADDPQEFADLMHTAVTFFVPARIPKGGKEPIVPMVVNRQGRNVVEWFRISVPTYNAVASMAPIQMPDFPGLPILEWTIYKPTRVMRAGTTGLRASFGLVTNMLRDPQTLWRNSQAEGLGGALMMTWLKHMQTSAIHAATGKEVSPYLEFWLNAGGTMAQSLGRDIPHTRRAARRVFEGRVVRTLDPRNWFDAYREFIQFPEAAPRVAEIERMAIDRGIDITQPIQPDDFFDMLLAGKQVTTDFTASGTFGRVARQVFPFWNAAVQGPRANLRAAGRNWRRFAFRTLALTGATLLAWYQNKDEDWYKVMPWREKFLYWHFPFMNPFTGMDEILRIPRDFEAGLAFNALPELLVDAWYRQDPAGVRDWMELGMDASNPFEMPVLLGAAKNQWTNEDDFFKTPVVPQRLLGKPPHEQHDEYTSRASIFIANLFPEARLSPKRLDKLFSDVFGPVGGDVVDALGLGAPGRPRDPEAADTFLIGRMFLRGGPQQVRTQPVIDLYAALEKMEERQASTSSPETPEQRQLRLMATDVSKAIGRLYMIRSYTPQVEKRRALTAEATRYAVEAMRQMRKGSVTALERSEAAAARRRLDAQADQIAIPSRR